MAHLKTILVPIDFSAHANHAFEIAWSLARDYAGRLVLIHVIPPPIAGSPEMGLPTYPGEEEQNAVRHTLSAMKCPGVAVPVECIVKIGHPAAEIVEQAQALGCDMIVLGTHGRGGLTRVLLGSVAEEIMRHAPCPVLTVKQTAAMPASPSAKH